MNNVFKKVYDLTDTTAKTLIAAALLLILVGYADYITGYEVAFSFFYLLPIMLLTWRMNLRYGLAASVVSALVWLMNDYGLTEHTYASPLIPYWNTLVVFVFFVVFVILLTRIRLLLQNEKAQSKLKSSMIHTVSHEFNNALTVMSAGIFLLKETEPDPEDETRARLLMTLENSHAQMALYIKNILNEARMEEGRFKLEKKNLLLRDLVAECVLSDDELLKQKGISLEIRQPESPVFISADREALALVVSNLLGNAIKYTPKNGSIVVEISASGMRAERVVLSVEDTGIGISLADLKKITTGFYRTDEGKGAADGFGLGLRISNDLLVLHGSRLEIASEKGKGSSFFFELPALPLGAAEKNSGK